VDLKRTSWADLEDSRWVNPIKRNTSGLPSKPGKVALRVEPGIKSVREKNMETSKGTSASINNNVAIGHARLESDKVER